MLKSQSRFQTGRGPRYLAQMCKHFAHKVEVTHDDTHGTIALPPGSATLDADDHGLSFEVIAADPESLDRVKSIMESHIIRFAFRDNLEKLDWTDGQDGQ
ncbi:MAG: DUF2218 domain-containing protein [Geminicoccaceae bacterium]